MRGVISKELSKVKAPLRAVTKEFDYLNGVCGNNQSVALTLISLAALAKPPTVGFVRLADGQRAFEIGGDCKNFEGLVFPKHLVEFVGKSKLSVSEPENCHQETSKATQQSYCTCSCPSGQSPFVIDGKNNDDSKSLLCLEILKN